MSTILVFGPFRLDAEAEILLWGTEPVALGRRAVALLRVLVERPEMLVSKDALIEAAWAGLSVEESNLTVQIAALRRVLARARGGARWIETLPRRGYRFVGPPVMQEEACAGKRHDKKAAVASADKPSIAVLAFNNMSGDPEQEYFADGIVEELITALSRMRWLFVIARNSSFTYKGRAIDVKQVGRELGVRYVLEGGVRKAASRVRITAQLIDALTGAHLWADRFEGALDDIFDLQDRVTQSVVGAIAPKLQEAEIERVKHKPTANLDAYDYYLRGIAISHPRTRESNDEALRLFYKAIELDPDFSSAYGMAAWCYVRRKGRRWTTDRAKETSESAWLARRVAELGKEDAVALATGGFALAYVVGDLDDGTEYIDRALILNPNLAAAWTFSGWVRIFLGEHETAIEHFARSMRLSPLPLMYAAQNGIGLAYFCAGRYDEASSWAEKALLESQTYHPALRVFAASNALAGRLEEAQKAMARLREIDPTFRASDLSVLTPLRRPQDVACYAEGLRRAGLPE